MLMNPIYAQLENDNVGTPLLSNIPTFSTTPTFIVNTPSPFNTPPMVCIGDSSNHTTTRQSTPETSRRINSSTPPTPLETNNTVMMNPHLGNDSNTPTVVVNTATPFNITPTVSVGVPSSLIQPSFLQPAVSSTTTDSRKNTPPETNRMPGHGRNVHFGALMPYCDYYSFADTFRFISNTPFVYNPLATHTTMRFRNMAFERTATAIPDIQCILFVLFGPEPVAFNMHPVVKRAPYFDVDIVTMNRQRVLSILSQKLIVIDRHGFHLVRGTVTSESIQTRRGRQTTSLHPNSHETAAVLDYCKSVRNLPQKDRHFMMDGLPSVPLLVEVAPPPKSAAPVSGKQSNCRRRQKSP